MLDDVDDLCDDVFSVEEIRELDQIVSGYSDQEIKESGTEEVVDVRNVLENLSFEEDHLSKPPETFSFPSFISVLKNTSFLAKQTNALAYRKNTLFDALLTPNCIEAGECFVKILWNRNHKMRGRIHTVVLRLRNSRNIRTAINVWENGYYQSGRMLNLEEARTMDYFTNHNMITMAISFSKH